MRSASAEFPIAITSWINHYCVINTQSSCSVEPMLVYCSFMNIKKTIGFCCLLILLSLCQITEAAKVDSLDIPSTAMHKTYKAAVILPDSYAKSKAAYPVLYL